MKIPAEFEDIFRGVELTEREALFLSWITSWDDYTIQNMRTVVEKVRSAFSTLQAENEKLRAEQERVKRERDAAVKQEFIPGGNVWIVERDEDGEATEVSGYVFVASVSGVAIVSPSINGCRDLDFILGDFVKETARSFSGDFSGYPISDCHESYEEADAALRREQDG